MLIRPVFEKLLLMHGNSGDSLKGIGRETKLPVDY